MISKHRLIMLQPDLWVDAIIDPMETRTSDFGRNSGGES